MTENLLSQLSRYEAYWKKSGSAQDEAQEENCLSRFRTLLKSPQDPFRRSHLPGHVTGSAVIVSRDRSQVLLTHHRKLGMWLQLGGHVDENETVMVAAEREAREESGLKSLRTLVDFPIDLDIHGIPANSKEPAHDHYDVRFLLEADETELFEVSSESNDLKWFSIEQFLAEDGLEAMKRQLRKVEGFV